MTIKRNKPGTKRMVAPGEDVSCSNNETGWMIWDDKCAQLDTTGHQYQYDREITERDRSVRVWLNEDGTVEVIMTLEVR
jgi:hypothetical protein